MPPRSSRCWMWVWPKSASRAPASFAAPASAVRSRFDAVEMAVGHKNAHAVKLQRQALRNRRGIVAVAGHIIEIRFLTGEGQILRIGQMVAQMHNRVRVFFFYGVVREAEAPVRIRQNQKLHMVHFHARGAYDKEESG